MHVTSIPNEIERKNEERVDFAQLDYTVMRLQLFKSETGTTDDKQLSNNLY
jgi:hypothetical protein